ncbi:hypothetical protein TREPR_0951 [Treponema primitia ZAS-2]|uniref:Uncharacterized protein n=1 Tax=Treponema primitia (strain ATCC BAA-887 / DSM 12427 / ZAS-2) TaxID=545694 RepID=F5YI49_TREPZ|nr:hypothetical protein TREPR_0951 [Treponema primitia ZAS-2]
MPLNENDLSYLIDIVDCIQDITEFTKSIFYNGKYNRIKKQTGP